MGKATVKFDDFSGQEEVKITSKPQVKLFKKWDKFIGFIKSISDNRIDDWIDNGMGGISYGNKVFTFVAISWTDHKSDDGTGTWEAVENPIIAGEEYNFFTNYVKKGFLNVNGSKLSALPLGAIVKLENMGKKKSEKSNFSFKLVSIIWKKDDKWEYIIHPDYKAVDNFDWQEEISVENLPFS